MFLKFGGVLNSGSRAEEGSGEESARASLLDFWRDSVSYLSVKIPLFYKLLLLDF